MSGFTLINVGATANDGNGDSLRVSQQAINTNYISTVRALATTSSLTTELAASGYVRLIYNDLGAQVFAADNSGLTVDNIRVFTSATVGWTWVRTTPAWVDITAPRFRCISNDSTDNATNLQAAADYALETNLPLRIPAGTYKTTDFINFYDLIIIGDGRERSIIKSYATSKPVGVFTGSHAQVRGLTLSYDSRKTDVSCANMLISGYAGAGTGGWYWGSCDDIGLTYGDTPLHTLGTISTTLTSDAANGATTIAVNALSTGGFQEIVSGAYLTVTLDAGSQVVQVDSISGTTLTLRTALTGAATAGNAVTGYESVFFSNSISNLYIRYWNRYAVLHRGSGTGSAIHNIYMGNGEADTYPSCVGALYLSGVNDLSIGQINCEWMTITGSSVVSGYGGETMDSASWHFEGIKFGGSSQSLFSTSQKSFEAKSITVDRWDVPSSVGAFGVVRLEASSADYSPVMEIKGIAITNSRFETPSNFYWGIDLNSNKSRLLISNVTLNKDSGCKVRDQLMSSSAASPTLKRLTPYFDESVLAYGLAASLGVITDVTMYARTIKGSPEQINIGNCAVSLSAAVAEVRTATGGGGTAIMASSALSAITDAATYFTSANDAGIDNVILDWSSDGKLYLRVTTNQSGSAVSGASVSVSRTNAKADGGTGICKINWSTTTGVNVGDVVTTSGFTDTDFNGTFTVIGVGSNYIEFYKYTGTAKETTADTGGSITKLATADIFIKGQDWGRNRI